MRIVVPVVVELSDQQVTDYGSDLGMGAKPRAKDVVENIRGLVVEAVRAAFEGSAYGSGADVTLKER